MASAEFHSQGAAHVNNCGKPINLATVVFLMSPNWVVFLDYPIKDRNLVFRRYSFVVDKMAFDAVNDNPNSVGQRSIDLARGDFINSMIYSCRPIYLIPIILIFMYLKILCFNLFR